MAVRWSLVLSISFGRPDKFDAAISRKGSARRLCASACGD
jgi:hypothetical protein